MSFELKGKIDHIGEVNQITEKFKKLDFVISVDNQVQDKIYTEHIKFQLVQDKCSLLDGIGIGQEVNVMFNIKGSKSDKNGVVIYFNNLDAWKIAKVGNDTGTKFKDFDAENPPF